MKLSFGWQVAIGMVAGLVLGFLARPLGEASALGQVLKITGDVFVQLLKALVVPLVFTAIVASVAALADLEETAAYAPRMMDGFWAPTPYYGFLNTFVYPDERVSVDRYEIVEADRRRTFWTWIQYFDPTSITDELAASGFAVERLLGNVAGDPYDPGGAELAVVARRAVRRQPEATD